MQNIRSVNTLPERMLAQALRKENVYFARNVRSLPGKPDFVFRKAKIVVFVDSDFWHFHPKRAVMPKTNRTYWVPKLKRNVERDAEVNREFREKGWIVLRFWEFDVKKKPDKVVKKILTIVTNNKGGKGVRKK